MKLRHREHERQHSTHHTVIATNRWCRHSPNQTGDLHSLLWNQRCARSTFLIASCVSKSTEQGLREQQGLKILKEENL